MQIRRKFLFVLFFALTLVACNGRHTPNAYQLSGNTMGTSYNITIVGEELVRPEIIDTALEDIENTMSTYRMDSELMQLNEAPINTWINVSQSLYEVLQISEEISLLSNGAFDITVAPLVNLWGFGPIKRESGSLPDENEIQSLMNNIGFQHLILAENQEATEKHRAVHLDLSAVAKGYAVDVIAALLEANNISNYLVEIGGEIRSKGRNANGELWRIAIELPERSTSSQSSHCIIQISNISVASSGDYRNFYEVDGMFYSHTIDPRNGYPVEHNLASVTVLAESAAIADALATAFNVMGTEQAMILANSNNIPAYFLVKTVDDFAASYSTTFAQYINEEK